MHCHVHHEHFWILDKPKSCLLAKSFHVISFISRLCDLNISLATTHVYICVHVYIRSHVRVLRVLRHEITDAVLARAHVGVAERRDELLSPEAARRDAWAEDSAERPSVFRADGVVNEWVDGAVAV